MAIIIVIKYWSTDNIYSIPFSGIRLKKHIMEIVPYDCNLKKKKIQADLTLNWGYFCTKEKEYLVFFFFFCYR